jgi:hypothetical protein
MKLCASLGNMRANVSSLKGSETAPERDARPAWVEKEASALRKHLLLQVVQRKRHDRGIKFDGHLAL